MDVVSLSVEFGFDAAGRQQRLEWLDLGPADEAPLAALGELLARHLTRAVDRFYERMTQLPAFHAVVQDEASLARLRASQIRYLENLGRGFATEAYFSERLRVGQTHARVGVPVGLYICACQTLERVIRDLVIDDVAPGPARDGLVLALGKIMALDMSLAVETYHRSRVGALETAVADLGTRARTDQLTGLANRDEVLGVLAAQVRRAHDDGGIAHVAMIDVDHFKRVNDSHGHLAGDAVLREIAARIRAALRSGDVVGRYGGEEFLVVLAEGVDPGLVDGIAERVRQRVCDHPIVIAQAPPIRASVSVGVAELHPGDTPEQLIARADAALFEAKHAGRNLVRHAG